MLVSSHVLAEVAQTRRTDVVIIANAAARSRRRRSQTILASGGHGTRVRTPRARRTRGRAATRRRIESTAFEDDALVSSCRRAADRRARRARTGIVLHELTGESRESLEDVFLQLTEGESSPS